MSELISGKEAKLAWAEGVDVQVATGPDKFRTLVSSDNLGIFDCGNYFRLKPRTISINGIEVPAPFKPNIGDGIFVLCPYYECGYRHDYYQEVRESYIQFGAWRTEEEIKQVVAAMRRIFNPQ